MVLTTHYAFAEDNDVPERRGLFDLAIDVFGSDDDKVVGAFPTRVVIEDTLSRAETVSYIDYDNLKHGGEKIVDILGKFSKDEDDNAMKVRSSDFLKVAKLVTREDPETGTPTLERKKPEGELGIHGYEGLMAALQGAADFDAKSSYLGYLLESLVGYQLKEVAPYGGGGGGGNEACRVVEDIASRLIDTKTRISTSISEIMDTRGRATSVENVNDLLLQRNALLEGINRVRLALLKEVTPKQTGGLNASLLSALRKAEVTDDRGNWMEDNFKVGNQYGNIVTPVDSLPTNGPDGLRVPDQGKDGLEEGEAWIKPLDPTTFVPVIAPPLRGSEMERVKQGATMTKKSLRILNILAGNSNVGEQGLISRLSTERYMFGRILGKVDDAVEKKYQPARDAVVKINKELRAVKTRLYSDEGRKEAVLMEASKNDASWTSKAQNAITIGGYDGVDGPYPARLLKSVGAALALPADVHLPETADITTNWAELAKSLESIYTVMRHIHANRVAMEASALNTIKTVRTALVHQYNMFFARDFATESGARQQRLQRDNFASTQWYSDHKDTWDKLFERSFPDEKSAFFVAITGGETSVNDPSTPLGATEIEELAKITGSLPASVVVETTVRQANTYDTIENMVKEWITSLDISRSATLNTIQQIREHVDPKNPQIRNKETWNKNPLEGVLSFKQVVLDDGKVKETGATVNVEISRIKDWVGRKTVEVGRDTFPMSPLYVLKLLPAYTEYVEGMLANLSNLTKYCGENEGGIYELKPAKGAGQVEGGAAALLLSDREQEVAAGEILRLLMSQASLYTNPSENNIDLEIVNKGYNKNNATGYTTLKTTKSYSGFEFPVGVSGKLYIPEGWDTSTTTLEDAASKIWNKLVFPRIKDNGKWIDAWLTCERDLASANYFNKQMEAKYDRSLKDVETLRGNIGTIDQLKLQLNYVTSTSKKLESALEKKEKALMVATEENMVAKQKLEAEKASCAEKLVKQRDELSKIYTKTKEDYIRATESVKGGKEIAEFQIKQIRAQTQRAEKLAPTLESVVGSPLEEALQREIAALKASTKFYQSETERFAEFIGDTVEYVQQVRRVSIDVKETINRVISSVDETTTENREKKQKLRNNMNNYEQMVTSTVNMRMEPEMIVDNMHQWVVNQNKALRTNKTFHAGFMGMVNIVIDILTNVQNSYSSTVTENTSIRQNMSNLEKQLEEHMTGISGEEAATLRTNLNEAVSVLSLMANEMLAVYAPNVIESGESVPQRDPPTTTFVNILKTYLEKAKSAKIDKIAVAGPSFIQHDTIFWKAKDTASKRTRSVHDYTLIYSNETLRNKPASIWNLYEFLLSRFKAELRNCYRRDLTWESRIGQKDEEISKLQSYLSNVEELNHRVETLRVQVKTERAKVNVCQDARKALQEQLKKAKVDLGIATATTKELTKLEQAVSKREEAMERGHGTAKESGALKVANNTIRELTAIVDSLRRSIGKGKAEEIKELEKSYKAQIAQHSNALKSANAEISAIKKEHTRACNEEIKALKDSNVRVVNKLELEYRKHVNAIKIAQQEALKAAKEASDKEGYIRGLEKGGKASVTEINKLERELEQLRTKYNVQERKATQAIVRAGEKEAVAIRKREVALLEKERANIEAKSLLKIQNRRKAIDRQLEEIQQQEEELKEQLRIEANKEKTSIAERTSADRAAAAQLAVDIEVHTEAMEKINETLNKIIDAKEQLEEDKVLATQQLKMQEVEYDAKITMMKQELAYLREEIPTMEDIISNFQGTISDFSAIYNYMNDLFLKAHYPMIINYGNTRYSHDEKFIPFPSIQIFNDDTGTMEDYNAEGDPAPTFNNINSIFTFYKNLGFASLQNSGAVASTWIPVKNDLDECESVRGIKRGERGEAKKPSKRLSKKVTPPRTAFGEEEEEEEEKRGEKRKETRELTVSGGTGRRGLRSRRTVSPPETSQVSSVGDSIPTVSGGKTPPQEESKGWSVFL